MTDSEPVTVLLVGGDADLDCLVRQGLAGPSVCHHRVVNVHAFGEALSRLAEGGIDAVLLKIESTYEAAIDAVGRLREAAPHVPILALAVKPDAQVEAEVMRMGVQDYLPEREITADVLARSIRHATVRHAMLMKLQKDRDDCAVVITAIRRGEIDAVLDANTESRMIRLQDEKHARENERLMGELARSNAELEQFAYVASHDLKEPLRMVASYTSLLAEAYRGKLDAEADKYIHYATDGAKRMQELIEDLLEYSRVGRTGDGVQPVEIQNAADWALMNLEHTVKELDARIDVGPMPTVVGREGELNRLFQNIIGNALKFHSDQKPHVEVSSAWDNGDWRITIADNGIGIEPEYLERIFGVFQRLHTREEYPGTGIGLAVCKKTVERHGGRIWVESEPGNGTKFHFTLPACGAGTGAEKCSKFGVQCEECAGRRSIKQEEPTGAVPVVSGSDN